MTEHSEDAARRVAQMLTPGNDPELARAAMELKRTSPIADESGVGAVANYELCARCIKRGRTGLQATYWVKIGEGIAQVFLNGRLRSVRYSDCKQWCLACDGRPPLDRVISDPVRSDE